MLDEFDRRIARIDMQIADSRGDVIAQQQNEPHTWRGNSAHMSANSIKLS